MNYFGLIIGIAALLIIGLGFPLVIQGERRFGYSCWPYMMGVGVLLVVASIFVNLNWISAIVGVLGATFVWGSTELKEQAVRTELGWYPFNPNKIKLPFSEIIKTWKAPHL
jgi:lysylphosphatidylglycerol synthetase-like protein (DUF2156 family)